jgi:RNA polymerase sigma factor (sigma-70 family)
VAFEDGEVGIEAGAEQVLEVDRALDRLSARSERLGQVVELRFFCGLSVDEAAETLGVTSRTIKRDWRKARAFLFRELQGEASEEGEALEGPP